MFVPFVSTAWQTGNAVKNAGVGAEIVGVGVGLVGRNEGIR